MFFEGSDITTIIGALLILVGTWLTARVTKSNSREQAKIQLKQVDQSAYAVAENIYKGAIARLEEENEELKAKNEKLEADKVEFLEKLQRMQEEINDMRKRLGDD